MAWVFGCYCFGRFFGGRVAFCFVRAPGYFILYPDVCFSGVLWLWGCWGVFVSVRVWGWGGFFLGFFFFFFFCLGLNLGAPGGEGLGLIAAKLG